MKLVALPIVGLALLALALVALDRRAPVPSVPAVRVARENLNAVVSSNGKVEPIEPYPVRARVATFVERVIAVEGQTVKRGQLLMTLNSVGVSADLARAREELVSAQDQLRAARAGGRAEELAQLESDTRKTDAELARLRRVRDALGRLLDKQAATREELDQNKLALERAEAESRLLHQKREELARRSRLDAERAGLLAEQARNEIRSLEEKIHSAHVTAPLDAILYSLPVHTGDYLQVGDMLAQMADLRRVRVRAFVDEPELGLLERGQPVEITWDAVPNRVWTGVTEQLPKAVVARGTRTVGELLCSVNNEKLELLPNVNVNVRIRIRERSGTLVIPRGAVRGEGPTRYVLVVEDSTVRKREIKVGIANATTYEVLEGLAEGDLVALPSDVELHDGMIVQVTERKR